MNQKSEENQVIQAIDNIFQKSNKSKFTEQFQKSVSKESQIVGQYLGIESSTQVILWSIIFSMSIQKNSTIDVDDFSVYLNISVLRAFSYSKELDELVKRKLLRRQKPHRRRRGNECLNYLSLYVPNEIPYNLVNGLPLPKKRISNLTYFELLDSCIELFQNRDDGFIELEQLCNEVENLLNENKNLPFVKQIQNFRLPSIEKVIILVLCQQFVEGYTSVELLRLLKTLYSETQQQINSRKEWINGKTKLQQLNLVDLDSESSFKSDKSIQLTPKGQMVFGEDRHLFVEQDGSKNKNLIPYSSISEKHLFFNEKEQKQVERLNELLIKENHESFVSRLKDLGYNSGLTILLHGHPGTGKTELINQLARLTGRDIYRVDISECKSKWFGESQKRVKSIFDTYKKQLESSEKISPILLFNELDGIFGQRKTLGSSSVEQEENAIQTVLLQELESFPLNGILMASTNLPKNLDKAFDRRFLYKMYFESPNSETRFHIWKDKLPFLSDNEIQYFSNRYPYTGGQIDNLSKKCQMELIFGRPINHELIEVFCNEESIDKTFEKKRIGYLG